MVLFPESLLLALRLHLQAAPDQVFLLETRQRRQMTTRWVQLLATRYGEAAGIERMHPHRLRHTVLTNLSRSGLTDTQIQQLSGHATKKSLAVYQHLALADVAKDYQDAMREHEPRRMGKSKIGHAP
jgi:integrase